MVQGVDVAAGLRDASGADQTQQRNGDFCFHDISPDMHGSSFRRPHEAANSSEIMLVPSINGR
jgi:hypothetical protein